MLNYAELEDNVLQTLASEGNREAEEVLAERYLRLVRICARPLFLAGGDSEDLIQEGMFGLLSAIRNYKPDQGTAFKTFAEHCIRNRLISAVRSAASIKHFPLNDGVSYEALLSDESQIPLLAYAELFRRTPEEQVLARENKESTEEIFLSFSKQLSKYERTVFNLYLNGLSYKEIAQSTAKNIKAVDNAIQRIRRKLAQMLKSGDISNS